MKKINLPIQVDETVPSRPNIKWGIKMISILIIFIVVGFLGFYMFSYVIIANISLEKEIKMFGNLLKNEENFSKFDKKIFGNKLEDFPYNLYLRDIEDANAFASIGGNIAITKGLLEEIKYEEEILFVIGHEKGHIENRDPLRMFTTNFPFQTTFSYIGYNIGFDFSQITSMMGNILSKNMEINADNYGINFVQKKGLNPGCVLNFFQKNQSKNPKFVEFFGTHPMTETRINNLKKQIGIEEINFEKCTKFKY
ncbi:M48 family metallopeptidase [Candidatus Vampirococcus lugosii]|uniref:Peptidase family M48 n=1 Tax=Candidatus Vampirococcus lugosii TaxID=2789015 RepID=A0ABS5QLA0_9BACT|nr:M48 family metallopeptidase [Candidatus Vampirococcus lugosii]MBS8121990.1 Peptidase family M48 [Candidatus Vampirococcus lugosii]